MVAVVFGTSELQLTRKAFDPLRVMFDGQVPKQGLLSGFESTAESSRGEISRDPEPDVVLRAGVVEPTGDGGLLAGDHQDRGGQRGRQQPGQGDRHDQFDDRETAVLALGARNRLRHHS